MADPDDWVPRFEIGVEEVPDYVNPDHFTVKVYHGGYLQHIDGEYVGGTISYYDHVDKDKMSLIEVDGMVKGINHEYHGTRIDYYYSIGCEEDAKTKLNTDSDVIRMCCMVPEIRLVILYLDHLELDPNYSEEYDDLFMYEDQIPAWSHVGSTNIVIEELIDSPRKDTSSVNVEEEPDLLKLIAISAKPGKKVRRGVPGVRIIEHEDVMPTQASRAPAINPTDKGKGKQKAELVDYATDSDDEGPKHGVSSRVGVGMGSTATVGVGSSLAAGVGSSAAADPAEPTRNPKHWCGSHFKTWVKCDVLLNNLCESFNAIILPCRGKPVIGCFEEIRTKLMKRIAVRLEKMNKVVDSICPKPREILEKNKVKSATDCIPSATGSYLIEVESTGGTKYVVDMQRRTCACRRWDLTGIPCKHAISAIQFMRQKPEDYVDVCYLTKTYLAIYSHTVKPVNGMDLWLPSGETPIIPPKYNRPSGRPPKRRKRDASERDNEGPKLARNQKSVTCSNCGRLGHNVKTCHRHLPPKEPFQKKIKLNTGKPKGTKPLPKTKNELRAKALKRTETEKEKRGKKRAAEKAASNKAARATTSTRRGPTAPTSSGRASSAAPQASQVSTRTSVRLNGKEGGK